MIRRAVSFQYAFTVENEKLFEDWDQFLENQVKKAVRAVSNQTRYEKAKVWSPL